MTTDLRHIQKIHLTSKNIPAEYCFGYDYNGNNVEELYLTIRFYREDIDKTINLKYVMAIFSKIIEENFCDVEYLAVREANSPVEHFVFYIIEFKGDRVDPQIYLSTPPRLFFHRRIRKDEVV
jgi:hypothetical protein